MIHMEGSRKFDCRCALGKRAYLQCVLALPELLKAGITKFESGWSNACYRLMFQTKRPVDPKMPAKEVRRLLAQATGDDVAAALLDSAPALALPSAQMQALPAPPPIGDADDSSIAGGQEPDAAPAKAAGFAASSSAQAVMDGADDEVAGDEGEAPLPPVWPPTILGQSVSFIQGRHDTKWQYRNRISVKCRNPTHEKCAKSRSLELDTGVHGPRAAEGFLGAWLLRDNLPKKEHSRFMPSREEVRAFLADE